MGKSYGIWIGPWSLLARSIICRSAQQKAETFSGILQHTFWAKVQSVITSAVCRMAPPLNKASSTIWRYQKGEELYESWIILLKATSQAVNQTDYKPLEDQSAKFFKEKQPFERLHVSIPDLKEMFGYSKYKMYYIENLLPPEGSTVYKCGTLVDLCTGPHIQNTAKIKAFKVMKVGLSSKRLLSWLTDFLEFFMLFQGRQRRRFVAENIWGGLPRQKGAS